MMIIFLNNLAKKIGEQCFYRAACTFADQHSTCTQVQHKAVCDCSEGYHKVVIGRPNKRVFCAEGKSIPSESFTEHKVIDNNILKYNII